MAPRFKVFRTTRFVRRRDGGGTRYRVELIARGTGTMMYSTPALDTREAAQERAKAYIAKNADAFIDTTEHE